MSIYDLEEVNFFFKLYDEEYQLGMAAARKGQRKEWLESRERMKLLSFRLKQAMEGHYGHLKA